MRPRLSVVIPAYNEEENIHDAVYDVHFSLPDAEVIVVNDASTDNTINVLDSLPISNLKVITNLTNSGHGLSVLRGLMAAKGDYILYIDADRQISLSNFSIPLNYDFVSGYRAHRQDKLFRKFVSFCLRMTNLLRHGYYIRDANCPFKIYRREAVQELILELPPTCIVPIACLEVLARRYKYKTATIRKIHHEYKGQREGKLQSINPVSLKFFWDAFKEVVTL